MSDAVALNAMDINPDLTQNERRKSQEVSWPMPMTKTDL